MNNCLRVVTDRSWTGLDFFGRADIQKISKNPRSTRDHRRQHNDYLILDLQKYACGFRVTLGFLLGQNSAKRMESRPFLSISPHDFCEAATRRNPNQGNQIFFAEPAPVRSNNSTTTTRRKRKVVNST